ncbi:DNA damage-regulated autophagy modulator protein 1 isoform X2 [Ambystoma mexicanum]|uniref:DNA damage-regulated autophagy modulator protein 1 isoform X2 n=1 Tax=Ambystoma mexicanum TaxID=8296 RepID=UPI0037E74949
MHALAQGIAYIPALLVVWSAAAFLISYLTAVVLGHVEPFVPYISDTGTTPPESAIFGFMISITSILGTFTMYARYKILQKQNEVAAFVPHWFNVMALMVGVLGSIGMVIVATFQEGSVPVIHDTGALITFLSGVFYILLQSIISYRSCPEWNSRRLCHVRMAISLVSLAALIPMIACSALVFFSYREWQPRTKDSKVQVASAVCEWIVAFGFVLYFLTYIQEFKKAEIKITTELHDGTR